MPPVFPLVLARVFHEFAQVLSKLKIHYMEQLGGGGNSTVVLLQHISIVAIVCVLKRKKRFGEV